jgi:hypothetical protein
MTGGGATKPKNKWPIAVNGNVIATISATSDDAATGRQDQHGGGDKHDYRSPFFRKDAPAAAVLPVKIKSPRAF